MILFIQSIYVLKDGLFPDDFLSRIHSEEDSLLEEDEVCLAAAVHYEVLEVFLILDIKILSWPPNLCISKLRHNIPKPIIQEEKHRFGITFSFNNSDLFQTNFIVPRLNLRSLLQRRRRRQNIHSAYRTVGYTYKKTELRTTASISAKQPLIISYLFFRLSYGICGVNLKLKV